MKYRVVAAIVIAAVSSAAEARPCAGSHRATPIPSGTRYDLDLSGAPGATEIRFEESIWPDFRELLRSKTYRVDNENTRPALIHYTGLPTRLYYRITAFNSADPSFVPCTYSDYLDFTGDPVLLRQERTSIVPVVGSVAGAHGARFRTSMTLANDGIDPMRGTIVFHPIGVTGSDSDPSLRYSLAPGESIRYDDLLASLNTSGLGSLDLIPDDDTTAVLPVTSVRVFNDGAGGATFGMSVPQVTVRQLERDDSWSSFVVPPQAQARMNVGVRTAYHEAAVEIRITHRDGRKTTLTRTYPARTLVQTSVDEFAGEAMAEGDQVVAIVYGSAVVYATETDNTTNDPLMRTRFGQLDGNDRYVFQYLR